MVVGLPHGYGIWEFEMNGDYFKHPINYDYKGEWKDGKCFGKDTMFYN